MDFDMPLNKKSMKASAMVNIMYLFKNPVVIIAMMAQRKDIEDKIKTARS